MTPSFLVDIFWTKYFLWLTFFCLQRELLFVNDAPAWSGTSVLVSIFYQALFSMTPPFRNNRLSITLYQIIFCTDMLFNCTLLFTDIFWINILLFHCMSFYHASAFCFNRSVWQRFSQITHSLTDSSGLDNMTPTFLKTFFPTFFFHIKLFFEWRHCSGNVILRCISRFFKYVI